MNLVYECITFAKELVLPRKFNVFLRYEALQYRFRLSVPFLISLELVNHLQLLRFELSRPIQNILAFARFQIVMSYLRFPNFS